MNAITYDDVVAKQDKKFETCAFCDSPFQWRRWRLYLCTKHSEDPYIRQLAWHANVAKYAPKAIADTHIAAARALKQVG